MSVENLTKWYVHINKFGLAAGRVVGSKDLCNPYLKYEVLVKFEEAMEAIEASSSSVQQLQAKIRVVVSRIDVAVEKCEGSYSRVDIANELRELSAVQ